MNGLLWIILLVFIAGILPVIVILTTRKNDDVPTHVTTTIIRPEFTECATPPCFNIGNSCPFPIWVHGVNNPATGDPVTLTPDNQEIQPGQSIQLNVPADWPAGRILAHYKNPTSFPNAYDFVEMTVQEGQIGFNISYVDWIALPSQLTAGPGADCGALSSSVECNVKVEDVLGGCPSGSGFSLLDSKNKRCLSAGQFCADPVNSSNPFCHLLDSTLQECVNNPSAYPYCSLGAGDTTGNVYSCSGYFDGQPSEGHTDGNKWCAALNRNMLSAPDSTDTSAYYSGTAINQYAKWIHSLCPGIYAFAYDDYPTGAEQSGFRECTTNRLDILWCPANDTTGSSKVSTTIEV